MRSHLPPRATYPPLRARITFNEPLHQANVVTLDMEPNATGANFDLLRHGERQGLCRNVLITDNFRREQCALHDNPMLTFNKRIPKNDNKLPHDNPFPCKRSLWVSETPLYKYHKKSFFEKTSMTHNLHYGGTRNRLPFRQIADFHSRLHRASLKTGDLRFDS